MEGLDPWGRRESQEFLETRGQQGKPDLEESRVITASQATVLRDEKE